MAKKVDFPSSQPRDTTTIVDGFFEREVYLSGGDTAAFLRTLADAVEDGNELHVSGDDWEIPFEFAEPIEVEIEFSNQSKAELEIEFEFEEPKTDTGDLNVE